MKMMERAFVIDKQLQGLLLSSDNGIANQSKQTIGQENFALLSMQDIVNAIVEPNSKRSIQTLNKVNTSSKYVIWYTHILENFTSMQSEARIAASSSQNNNIQNRQGRGFSLKITHQPTEEAVNILEVTFEQLTHGRLNKEVFLHCMWQQQLYVVPLGLPANNCAQTLISVHDSAYIAIANPESHLYLT